MISEDQLMSEGKDALEKGGINRVVAVEPDFEKPYLEVLVTKDSKVEVQVLFSGGGSLEAICLAAIVVKGVRVDPDKQWTEEALLALRWINDFNTSISRPWKILIKGMGVGFGETRSAVEFGDIWAYWVIPAELVEIGDMADLCKTFSGGLEREDRPMFREIFGEFGLLP
jgi:hypothetical protein